MPQSKASTEDVKRRKKRATEWKTFRRSHLFSQRRLAEIVGVSRRTIQRIENAYITPHDSTLRLFETLKRKHEDRTAITGADYV